MSGTPSAEYRFRMEISFTNLTYSRRASATVGERSFFMIKRFRGGEGHCKERRSLSCDPVNLSREYLCQGTKMRLGTHDDTGERSYPANLLYLRFLDVVLCC